MNRAIFMTAMKLLITVCGLDCLVLVFCFYNDVMMWTCKPESDATKRCIHLLFCCLMYFIFMD